MGRLVFGSGSLASKFGARGFAAECIGQHADPADQMFLDRGFGDSQAACDLLLRYILDAPHPDDLAASLWQAVEERGKALELFAPAGLSFGGRLVYEDVQRVHVLQQINGNDAVAARSVDEQVASDAEEERLRRRRALRLGGLEDTDIDVVANVLHIACGKPFAAEEAHEGGLVGKNFAAEPLFEGVVHGRTIALRVVNPKHYGLA